MKFGVSIFPTEHSIDVRELAIALEERGFESLWVAEHTHIPVSRDTPRPSRRRGPLPKKYYNTIDPFVVLSAAASVTRSLKLGTSICLVTERDPIITAKEVASIDLVSGGRFLFGVGVGWNKEEMSNHGTRFETRWALLEERLEAMKAIWTMDEAEYHGRYVDFAPMWCWPKPVQKPHPPIILGANGAKTLERVVRFADGWMPDGEYLNRMTELNRLAVAAGRDRIPVSAFWPKPEGSAIEHHISVGVERCVFDLPSVGRKTALRRLDALAELIEPYQVGA